MPRLRRTTVLAIALFTTFAFHLSDDYTHITPLYWQTAKLKGDRLWDTEPIEPYWEWNATTDANNLLLTHRHCEQAFHPLFKPIDQSVRRHKAPYNRIQLKDLDKVSGTPGVVRAMIYDQNLYIISTGGSLSPKSLMVLSQIHKAVTTSSEEIANIEFAFSTEDRPEHYAPSSPITKSWSFSRSPNDRKTWLMPDFGISTLSSSQETFHETRRKAIALDSHLAWEKKDSRLLWRGDLLSLSHQTTFLDATSGRPWADIQTQNTSPSNPSEMCKSKYLAHTSPIPSNALLHCTSVHLIPSPLSRVTLTSHLLVPNGPEQNYIPVKPDWSDAEDKVRHLREWDSLGERIARESKGIWRERWLTEAAEVCAWRRLMRGWAEVIGFEVRLEDGEGGERGVLWERVLVEGWSGEKL